MQVSLMAESLNCADGLIEDVLRVSGKDLSEFRELIAKEVYEEGHFSGNWDVVVECGDVTIRVIQEDEYDQHMDGDEDAPEWDDMVCDVPNGYLWFV